MTGKTISLLGWCAIALFVFGIIQLMMLRFSSGDIYPYYSSLRADPLGTKALYESLKICCDLQVERNHEPFSKIQDRYDSTLLVLGISDWALQSVPIDTVEQINAFLAGGGRVVITLYVRRLDPNVLKTLSDESTEIMDLTDSWGVRFFREERITENAQLSSGYRDSLLPRSISSHIPLYFQTVHPAWKTVYQRNQHPVMIERKLGRGSLVISAESYFLSNEALANERQPELLAWLVGSSTSVIFDEYHHGIASSFGVMYLARKYDLEMFLLVLLLFAILFVWRSAVPFVPPVHEPAEALQSGKESAAGLTNLLRRNISEGQLLAVCFQEWQKSAKDVPEEKRKMIEQTIKSETVKAARRQDLPAAYNAASRLLKERR